MDLVLCNILSGLIQKHERVALPQLGAFYHNKATGEIRFNKFDSWNDERFEYAYCSEYNVPFVTAKEEIAKFVAILRAELQQKSFVELPSIGRLAINPTEGSIDLVDIAVPEEEQTVQQEQTIFTPNKDVDFFALEKDKSTVNQSPKNQPIPSPIENNFQYPPMTNNKRSHPIHRWIILSLFILIGVFIILIYQIQLKVPDSAQSIVPEDDKSTLKENFDNYPIDVPSIDSNDLQVTDNNTEQTPTNTTKPAKKTNIQKQDRFYVIVGSRTSNKLAEEFQNSWKEKGYECKIINSNNKFRISVGSHATKDDAEKQLVKIKVEVPDAWIFATKE